MNFAAGGAPLVTIRLVEGEHELVVRTSRPGRLLVRGGGVVRVRAGEPIRIRTREATAAVLSFHPLLGEAPYADRARLEPVRRRWGARGVDIHQRLTGGIYGIAGRVVDNRRILLLAATDGREATARAFADRALQLDGARTAVFSELVSRPSGWLDVVDRSGARIASGDALVSLDVEGDATFTVAPAGRGAAHEGNVPAERLYRGRLDVTIDASGNAAAVLAVTLEDLLRGLVPSEIPGRAPREALKAQAVTARSNVLAQIGTRHLTDPYVLCSDVHCQAYHGEGERTPSTDAAVRETTGEALFGEDDRVLVDAVYSAVCGGHGEDNDAVWPMLASPRLRGRPDLPPQEALRWVGGLADETTLRAFLAGAQGWCGRATGLRADRYRWERHLASAQLDALVTSLRVGHVLDLEVASRGVSGRARSLVVAGDAGRAVIEGELQIRRLLGNLPSAMFVADREAAGFTLHGGGWGHGAGMCQWGAIGRAQAGQDYREILRAYYAGADVARIY